MGTAASAPAQQPNVYQQASSGLTAAMGGTAANMNYQPVQVQATNVTGQGYDAERAAHQGYTAQNIAGVDPITAQQVAAGQLAGTDLNPYMNPYQQAVVNQSMTDLERARQIQMAQMGAKAQAAGAFGGSRHGIADAETNRAFAEQAARTTTQLNQQNFQQAQAAAQQDIASRMQAALANQNANLQAATTTGQFGMQTQLANQAAQNQAGQFGANAFNTAALQNAQFGNQARQFSAQAANQAALANQQAQLQAAMANQSAGLQANQQNLGAASQMGSLANLGFGMGQSVQQMNLQAGAQQTAQAQALADAAKAQAAARAAAPAQSSGLLAQALGATPTTQSTTQTRQPGLFDYLTLGAAAL